MQGGSGTHLSKTTDIDFVTIASTGNASDFGDLTAEDMNGKSYPIQTRGLLVEVKLVIQDVIDYITIASTGNSIKILVILTGGRESPGGIKFCSWNIFAGGSASQNNWIYYHIINR